jgi:hypothetical protein
MIRTRCEKCGVNYNAGYDHTCVKPAKKPAAKTPRKSRTNKQGK